LTRGTFLFALWSLGVVALFMLSGIYAWSPFAEGGRAAVRPGIYGPTHK
jgi:hypothetical protein